MQSLVTELPLDENVLESMVGPDGFLTDAERLEKAAGKNINGIFPGVTILRPRNVKNFDQLPLEACKSKMQFKHVVFTIQILVSGILRLEIG